MMWTGRAEHLSFRSSQEPGPSVRCSVSRLSFGRPFTVFLILLALGTGCGSGAEESAPGPREERGAPEPAAADSATEPAISQAVYVPDYAHVYHGSGLSRFPLSTTLSVRNTDPERSITLRSVRYYNMEGELTRQYLDGPRRLDPLGTADFVMEEHDVSGGTGANFIVEWSADRPVSPPLIEAVMIGTRSGQGVSFTSRGQPIERTRP